MEKLNTTAPKNTAFQKLGSGYCLVHSCTSVSWSGLERYVVELAVQQKALGLSPTIFCREGSEIHKAALKNNISVWCVAPAEQPGLRLWWRMRQFYKDILPKNGNKIVLHLHHAGELKFHRPWLGRSDVKSILQFHLWITHKKQDPYHRWLYGSLTQVWCSTPTAKESLARLLPVAPERIKAIPYGRDVPSLNAVQKMREKERALLASELGLASDSVLAICVSRIESIKGVEELVRAFAIVAERNERAHLLIVGGVSPGNAEAEQYGERLKNLVSKLSEDVRRRLHMPGAKPSVEKLIAAADFYVLPSYEECVSLALLDAVILGLPAVGTNSGGTPSVITPEVNGLLVPPRDAVALSAALIRLYNDPALRQKFSAGNSSMGTLYDQASVLMEMTNTYSLL